MANQVTIQHSQKNNCTTSDAVIRAITFDRRLSPVDRNCWHVMHMLRTTDDIYAMSGLGQLRGYLTSNSCATRAAFATVWRAVSALRLTGWISVVGQFGDPLTGKIHSELYRVNERALDFHEACAIDPALADLLDSCREHASIHLSSLANFILNTTEDASEPGPILVREQRSDDEDPPSPSGRVINDLTPSEPSINETNAPVAPLTNQSQIRPDEPDSTYKKYLYKRERTYRAHTREESELKSVPEPLPPCLINAKADQQRDILTALKRLPIRHRQEVLDELQARSEAGTVRNVVAYFFALVKRVLGGEFRLWAGRQKEQHASEPSEVQAESPIHRENSKRPVVRPDWREAGHPHIAQIREILAGPRSVGELVKEVVDSKGWRDRLA